MPVVRIRSAVCLLGRFPALTGVDLDVDEGEVVLIAGPNGAGKSTLLRVIAGLVRLQRGEATVLGRDLATPTGRRAVRRDLALVGHETFCYDDLTVAENLRFVRRAAGRDGRLDAELLARLGLARLVDVPHGRLSAGQRRRLALALALARDPRLLLLDEPHAGLDPAGRDLLDQVVRESPRLGRTVLIASHEVDRAAGLADRRVDLAGGRVVGARPDHVLGALR